MAFSATTYKVFIASPSDIVDVRESVRQAIYGWNDTFAQAFGTILLPVLWETHSAPEMGIRPQEAINQQLLSDCDILIGVFSTRIGTSTGEALSGTVEEVEEAIDAGKTVMLYFDGAPVSREIADSDQYRLLREFEKESAEKGLYDQYEEQQELVKKIGRHLTQRVRDLNEDSTRNAGATEQGLRLLKSEFEKNLERAVEYIQIFGSDATFDASSMQFTRGMWNDLRHTTRQKMNGPDFGGVGFCDRSKIHSQSQARDAFLR